MVLESDNKNAIRGRPSPSCYLCGADGNILYEALGDLLFGVPGEWDLRKCGNSSCGLIWIDPMPQADDISMLYDRYHTHSIQVNSGWLAGLYNGIRGGVLACRFEYPYAAKTNIWKVFGYLLSFIRDLKERMAGEVMWLEGSRRGRLLDVGCGNGTFAAFMKEMGWHVTGVEPDIKAVQAVKDFSLIEVSQGSLEDVKFPKESFDAITMNHLIEHLPDSIQTLKESWRILKPGGRLVLTTPNTSSLGHLYFRRDWRGLEPPRHLFLYNSQSIRCALNAAGFKIKNLRTIARSASYILTMSNMLRKVRLSGEKSCHDSLVRVAKKKLCTVAFNQIWEALVLSIDKTKGEELLVIAEKGFS